MPAGDEGGVGFEGVTRLVSQGGRVGRGRDELVWNVEMHLVRQPHPVVRGLALQLPGAVDPDSVEEREDSLLWDQGGSKEAFTSQRHLNHILKTLRSNLCHTLESST